MSSSASAHVELALGAVDELTAACPEGLSSFIPDWQQELSAQAVNHRVQLSVLLEAIAAATPAPQRALVQSLTPLTEPVCRALTERGSRVLLQLPDHPGTASELFGVPVVRDFQDFSSFDLIVACHVGSKPPRHERVVALSAPQVFPQYRRALAAHRQLLAEQLATVIGREKHVVFVSRKVYFNQIRMSAALRRRGYRTAALVLDPASLGYFDGFFDHVLATDLCSLLLWVKSAEQALLHTQGWLFGYDLPVLVDAFLPPSSRHVVDMMDINSLLFPEAELEATLPFMRRAWGPDVEALQRKQVACEQYICRHADGVLLPGVEAHLDALGARQLGRDQRFLQFLVYPLAEFFSDPSPEPPAVDADRAPNRDEAPASAQRQARDLRLVFSGGVIPTGPAHPPELFGDAQMISTAELLLRQGLGLTVYNNPLIGPESSYAELYPEHMSLVARYPGYRFRLGAMPWEMKNLLRDYDYGLIVYDYTGMLFGPDHFRLLIPSKLFMYVEAGLPVLVSARAEATARFVEAEGIGKGVSDAELQDLPTLLDTLDHRQLKQNVLAARERLSMDVQIQRLIELYQRI